MESTTKEDFSKVIEQWLEIATPTFTGEDLIYSFPRKLIEQLNKDYGRNNL